MNIVKIENHYPMDLLLLADPSEKLVKAYLQKGQCYIAKEDNQIIGVYVLLPLNDQTVEIINIAVHEAHQGKGIGKAMLLDAIERARKQGVKRVEIGTGNSSIGQLALYQKCGFRISDVRKDFFALHYEEEIIENGIPCVDMIRLTLEL